MKTAINVIRTLEDAGYEAYMVGGAVRDFLLGKKPDDFDVATNAAPEKVKELFNRTVDTGIAHGTVLVLLDGEGIEVTTFRTDGLYTDMRRPDSVEFVQSLEEDLKRRDFTINAMAMSEDLHVIDLFGGKNDLKKRLIRAVGNSDKRFQEDALRMLRAVRFSGQLDFEIDSETLASIRRQAHLIRSVAVERIKTELDKIFAHKHTARSMAYLVHSGLSSNLPAGTLFELDWSNYKSCGDHSMGWCYMLYRQEKKIEDIGDYKFSNDEKRLMAKALEAARLEEWNAWTFYVFTARELAIARFLSGRDVDVQLAKKSLPIQSKKELAVTGNDLMHWSGNKQGPWLKKWLADIEQEIVFARLENNKEQIKGWFSHEYHRHA
ncbi:tRNA nucleotidyltransferase (CCA-adding enzyme) [Planomicrobium soli]|uniref:tRNA nucleotidyltransferase (CCA-adding enzyme) n=1 Tax=Planomicrobium soli TaxID=1176648 RepID=A0A2P8H6U9_9BACL|nr:CCA tRNA nucleotidyltransferase [Planomicrobium soli]PSL41957.1 tRNA nucleotidyltransferase (CCA-adding enzyme) [Planomicrobium soli]